MEHQPCVTLKYASNLEEIRKPWDGSSLIKTHFTVLNYYFPPTIYYFLNMCKNNYYKIFLQSSMLDWY